MNGDESTRHSAAHEQNRQAWDVRARGQKRFTQPIGDEELRTALAQLDPNGWLEGPLRGRRLLCLGSGGGRQSVIYAAAGATVTVVDISREMLDIDRAVATERGLSVRLFEASIDNLASLDPQSFDIVAQPVSTCYVPNIAAVYREIARVTCPGGLYISQHKQPASLQGETRPTARGYELIEPYYRSGPLPPVAGSRHREEGTLEFLHRWEELLGGLCRAGFVIEDLVEPLHAKKDARLGGFSHRSSFLPPYVRIKARRTGGSAQPPRALSVLLP